LVLPGEQEQLVEPLIDQFEVLVQFPPLRVIISFDATDTVLFAEITLLHGLGLPEERLVTITVVDPTLAKDEVTNVPLPAEVTVMEEVSPVAVFEPEKL
jgi:hypothetical protein